MQVRLVREAIQNLRRSRINVEVEHQDGVFRFQGSAGSYYEKQLLISTAMRAGAQHVCVANVRVGAG